MIKAVTTVCIILLVVGGALYAQGTIPARIEPREPVCVTSEERIIIRAATLAAIEDGLKDQLKFLFTGWLKDARQQPERAGAGLQKAIVAYQQARASALKWEPKIC